MNNNMIFKSVIIGTLTAISASAAEYLPLLQPGRSCLVQYLTESIKEPATPDTTALILYEVCEKTVVNNTECFVVKETWLKGDREGYVSISYHCENDGRASRIFEGGNSFHPYFDISLNDGDRIYVCYDEYFQSLHDENYVCPSFMPIVCVDYIEVRGIKRKRIHFDPDAVLYYAPWREDPDPNEKLYWVEGIGKNAMMDTSYLMWAGFINYPRIVAIYQDGEVIFENDDFFAPALTEIDEVEAPAPRPSRIYDLSGRPVTSPRPGQVYIQANKKFIQK